MEVVWITADLLIEDVMQAWPATLGPLLRRHMACIGCEAAAFHTLADIARIYEVPVEALLKELRDAAAAARSGSTLSPRYRPERADPERRSAAVARR
jgi:hybrid cluster-associated redox disulfide protein